LPKGEARVFVLQKAPMPNGRAGEVKEEAAAKVIHVGITDGLFTELTDDSDLPGEILVITDETDDKDDKKKKPF
jgi:hypothetical protein